MRTRRPDLTVTRREVPSPSTIELAERRVLPLLLNFHLMDHNLKALLVSTYLQGCDDMATTMFNHPELMPRGWPTEEYHL